MCGSRLQMGEAYVSSVCCACFEDEYGRKQLEPAGAQQLNDQQIQDIFMWLYRASTHRVA